METEMDLLIRRYTAADATALGRIFYRAVHEGAAGAQAARSAAS